MAGSGDNKTEQLILLWNDYHANFSTGLRDLLEVEELMDVTLACDGQYVQAHKLVLSVCSPYFRSLFKANPCKHPIVILKNVLYRDILAILQFMYRGEVSMREEELPGFLEAAKMLKINALTDQNNGGDHPKQRSHHEKTEDRPKPMQSANELQMPKLTQQQSLSVPSKKMKTDSHARGSGDMDFVKVTKQKVLSQGLPHKKSFERVLKVDKTSPRAEKMSDVAGRSGKKIARLSVNSKSSTSSPQSSTSVLEPSVHLQRLVFSSGIRGRKRSTSESAFVCSVCDKSFTMKFALNAHMRRNHDNDGGPFVCPLCEEMCENRVSLSCHMRNKHHRRVSSKLLQSVMAVSAESKDAEMIISLSS